MLEQNRAVLLALLQVEGGKTLDDAISEWREAIDYCRYYAAQARISLVPQPMPGPTGESNELRYRGRGVFVCISPWNFPLAIFLGQVTAALAAGNAVVAKPAEQTPLIASVTIGLLHDAGIPKSALQLVTGDGKVGAALVADPRIAGVAFTGSTQVGLAINRALAAKDGPIAPLIAETGGINAMIVDATALAGAGDRRCRHLHLPLRRATLLGFAASVRAGRRRRQADRNDLRRGRGACRRRSARDRDACRAGDRCRSEGAARQMDRGASIARTLPLGSRTGRCPPTARSCRRPSSNCQRASDLEEEVFGPVLHVVRFAPDELDTLLDEIAGNGTGLTLGIHSRIDARVAHIAARMRNGNVYVNRSMIGAVVGTQPFGGTGTSGTGPKAGGPNYLRRFATEQTFTVNTAAAGGNASLLASGE